jgi:hypothetical protein
MKTILTKKCRICGQPFSLEVPQTGGDNDNVAVAFANMTTVCNRNHSSHHWQKRQNERRDTRVPHND